MAANSYTDVGQHLFWLGSRSFGIIAIILLALAMTTGMFMSGKLMTQPGGPGWLKVVHEALSLAAMFAILTHGFLLIGDKYMHPGVTGVLVPGVIHYRPTWTAIGVIGGWLTAIFTFSFYIRKQIGVKRWRFIHRFTLAAYILAVIHSVGSGTDGKTTWMLVLLVGITAPMLFAMTFRYLPRAKKQKAVQPK